jgi:hypothetical protein
MLTALWIFAIIGAAAVLIGIWEGGKYLIGWGKKEEAVAKVKIENVAASLKAAQIELKTWLSNEIHTFFTDTSAVALKKIDAIVAWGKTIEARAEALEAKAAIVPYSAPIIKLDEWIENAVKAVVEDKEMIKI